jgi:cytochrome b subunit of formate dehydrogenase
MAWIRRFTKTERTAHWLVALAFGVMLLSSSQIPHGWTWTTPAFDVHVAAAAVLVAGLTGLLLFGNGRALRATARELRRLDARDRAWLHPRRLIRRQPPPAVGRFNGGQKLNARLALIGIAGLYASGIALTVFGHSPLGDLHGPFALLTSLLIAGHIFMAVVNPATRHALRGMTVGTVDREWAKHHFPEWVGQVEAEPDE